MNDSEERYWRDLVDRRDAELKEAYDALWEIKFDSKGIRDARRVATRIVGEPDYHVGCRNWPECDSEGCGEW